MGCARRNCGRSRFRFLWAHPNPTPTSSGMGAERWDGEEKKREKRRKRSGVGDCWGFGGEPIWGRPPNLFREGGTRLVVAGNSV